MEYHIENLHPATPLKIEDAPRPVSDCCGWGIVNVGEVNEPQICSNCLEYCNLPRKNY